MSTGEPPPLNSDIGSRPNTGNALLVSFLSFCVIGFGVWLVSAGARYRAEYADATQGWRVGTTRTIELTLSRADKLNLDCASDQVIAGLRCGYLSNSQQNGPLSRSNPLLLQPFNTMSNELLFAAGLWRSADLAEPLPFERFTAVCNYHIKGFIRSASIRFEPSHPFGPVNRTVTVGTLTDCVIPR